MALEQWVLWAAVIISIYILRGFIRDFALAIFVILMAILFGIAESIGGLCKKIYFQKKI